MPIKNYKIFILFLAASCLLVVNINGVEAKVAAKAKVKPPVRIFYYTGGKNAKASFAGHLKFIDVLAPQSYSIDSNGALKGSVDPNILALALKNKIKVMPLVTNRGFDRIGVQAFLDDTGKQDAAIQAMADEAVNQKFWGWQIDFEQMDAAYRDKFSAFVKKCGEVFSKQHLVVSVAVIAQISADPNDYPKNSWQYIVGVYDYAALAADSNFISIMSYDDPGSKGPAARYPWVKQVVDYALKFIPPEKLSLGLPLYYWQWTVATEKHVGTGGYSGIKNTLAKHRVARGYSAEDQAPFIRYTSNKTKYIIWYENAKSVKKDMDLITKYHLHGFSAWALGLESPDIYNAVKI